MPAGRGRKGNKPPRKRQGKQAQTTTTTIITRPGLQSTPNFANSSVHVTVPAEQQQQQHTAITTPPYPTPVPGMFIIYLLHFCPPKTSVCYGCSQLLKPSGVIQNPPHDLVIVSNMEREWHDGNMVHRKYSNVYFHCCCECVRKRYCSNFYISIPACMLNFLKPKHKMFLGETFGLNAA